MNPEVIHVAQHFIFNMVMLAGGIWAGRLIERRRRILHKARLYSIEKRLS
jgi:hypothetical protein